MRLEAKKVWREQGWVGKGSGEGFGEEGKTVENGYSSTEDHRARVQSTRATSLTGKPLL